MFAGKAQVYLSDAEWEMLPLYKVQQWAEAGIASYLATAIPQCRMIFCFKEICGRPYNLRFCFQVIITVSLQKTLLVAISPRCYD